ncbi:MAG TPA: 2-amino-4-hydroxy-6-hydroxymethyldihydropteridine diphosphokinase [Gemmataceae bacterium]|jgi:2-amino-4-hydroxy-6-hydroxymethyldihydropteridine diphosphokinase
MSTAWLGLGSNLGDRAATLRAALRRLRAEPGIRLAASSHFYETTPVDCPLGSPSFLNAAAAVETDRSPDELLRFLHEVERQFGRVRTEPNAPRSLDLDLLLYDDRIIDTPELVIPHPRMHERSFVLVPLAEFAGHVVHPVVKQTIQALADSLEKAGKLRPLVFAEGTRKSDELAGMQALVTGSTSGIGAAIASALEAHGAGLIRHGRRDRPGVERYIAADLTDSGACDRLANEAWATSGGLDLVVLNAGADTLTGDAAKWPFEKKLQALLAVDLKATMSLARDLGSRMKERGRGSIVTIGWDQAESGMEGDSGELFAAVKGAVMAFSRSLALSLAPEVRVNCIAPGWIRTAWGETASAEWQERVRRETPLGIWGLPEDVAEAVVGLARPAARYVTRQIIRVNGGAI